LDGRIREPVAALPAGAFAGVGGCAILPGGSWWNLYYRLQPELHGHGLAAELCQAALAAANSADPELPIVAFLVEHNHASKRTAERAGLQLQWRGPEIADPDAVRLIYADRPLDSDRLNAVINLP
jgi:RimJ/RimL family protein N-acetyltransferase